MSNVHGGDGRVLFASMPNAGLVNPLLTIARELNDRGGAELHFASMDERKADIEGIPGQSKVRFVSLGPQKPSMDPANWSDETYRALCFGSPLRRYSTFIDKHFEREYLEHLEAKCRQLIDEIDRIKPALIVADSTSNWAIDAARSRKIPFLLSVPVSVSVPFFDKLPWGYPTPFSGLPRDMSGRQRVANVAFRLGMISKMFRPAQISSSMAIYRQRKTDGLSLPMAPSMVAKEARAILGYSVFGLEYPFASAPEHLKMLGAMIPKNVGAAAEDSELSRWLSNHESIVYVGFGTIMRPTRGQVRAIVDASARLAPTHHVLWKLPKSQHGLLPPLASLPGNLRIEEWVPSQLEILAHPHVRAFFNHGGANAIHEGLYFSKPLLVMPFWMDCYDYAVRAADSGAALVLEHSDAPDAGQIAANLQRLLEDGRFRERAEHWARAQREAGGVSAAVDLILRALDGSGA